MISTSYKACRRQIRSYCATDKSCLCRLLPLLLGCLLLLQTTARADEQRGPNISDIFITTSQTHLLLFCSIKNGFTKEMIEGVQNGIPVTFSFFIKLDKTLNYWPDSTLTEMTIHHTLTYDALKQQYKVTQEEGGNSPVVTGSLDKAMAAMTELNGIKIINRSELVPDAPYALHVKATLAEKTLPLNMHYLVPFISLWNFETETRTIEFRY